MAAVRNQDTLDRLCEELETNAGDIALACSAVQASTGWLKRWMREDPKVDAAIRDAMDTGTAVLESEMIRRAVHGVDDPIFYKDEQVGSRKKYSDALLIKALESRKRDVYGKTVDVNQNVNIKVMSDDELDTKIAMLAERLGLQLALPAPDEAVTVDFEPCEIELEDLL
jgi:hypothetical protein